MTEEMMEFVVYHKHSGAVKRIYGYHIYDALRRNGLSILVWGIK